MTLSDKNINQELLFDEIETSKLYEDNGIVSVEVEVYACGSIQEFLNYLQETFEKSTKR